MTDYIPMTREGYNKKRAEISHLEQEEMPKIAEKIAAARAEGDLSENAEYHAQCEAQGMLQAKINKLKVDLSRASIVDPSKVPTDEVVRGDRGGEGLGLGRRGTIHVRGGGRRRLRRGTFPDYQSHGPGFVGQKSRRSSRNQRAPRHAPL